MIDEVDRRGFAVLGWLLGILLVTGLFSRALGLHWVQEVEWPTDLYALGRLERPLPVDVGIVGSSRSHYGLAPTAVDACLALTAGRATTTVSANRLAASLYASDIVARELFSGERKPRALVVEVAPESLNANHFELDYNVASSAGLGDVSECIGAATFGPPSLSGCARPLFRGVENIAFWLHRPLTEHRHITWMALYAGGGQYCFGTPACEARNADYDLRHQGRWKTRIDRVLPKVRTERFIDYTIEGGLPARHFVALLDRAKAEGVAVHVVNLPVSEVYQAEVPEAAYAEFLRWVPETTASHGGAFLDLNLPEWRVREQYIDPDHLNASGAGKLSARVCAELAGSVR